MNGDMGNEAINPIDLMCRELAREVRMNENRKPAEKICYTATVVGDDKKGCYIVIEGSAHQMADSFTELFKRRPELRQVVQGVLDKMYRIESR